MHAFIMAIILASVISISLTFLTTDEHKKIFAAKAFLISVSTIYFGLTFMLDNGIVSQDIDIVDPDW